MSKLLPDICSALDRLFPSQARSVIESHLLDYHGPEIPRVLRCIIQLADGDVSRLEYFVQAAKRDYRDVIYWAEYDGQDNRVRDYSKPLDAYKSI